MLGLDTNILVRYVVRDDATQLAKVDRVFEKELSNSTPGFVNAVVLAEFVWVLESVYRFSRKDIGIAVADLLASEQLELEHDMCVEQALELFSTTTADFADILVNLVNHRHGCTKTLTLDHGQRQLMTATILT